MRYGSSIVINMVDPREQYSCFCLLVIGGGVEDSFIITVVIGQRIPNKAKIEYSQDSAKPQSLIRETKMNGANN